jgi:uncharacterized protein YndB with AHSA1/START domain
VDRIERSVRIDAPPDRVWDLVCEAGFWLSVEPPYDGPLVPGETVVRTHGTSRYPIRVVEVRPKTYVSYRWASAYPDEDLDAGNSTLVEFTLEPAGEGTTLRVVESGFAALRGPEETRRRAYEDNTQGWPEELDKLRKQAES